MLSLAKTSCVLFRYPIPRSLLYLLYLFPSGPRHDRVINGSPFLRSPLYFSIISLRSPYLVSFSHASAIEKITYGLFPVTLTPSGRLISFEFEISPCMMENRKYLDATSFLSVRTSSFSFFLPYQSFSSTSASESTAFSFGVRNTLPSEMDTISSSVHAR